MKKFSFLILLCTVAILRGQTPTDPRLADYYFQNGEFEKAAAMYEQLAKTNTSDTYFDRYVACLLELDRGEECEKVVQKQIKKEPHKVTLYTLLGKVYERANEPQKAVEQYQKAIDKLSPDRFLIDNLAANFIQMTRFDLALQTYEKGNVLLKNKNIFAFNLADLYRRKGENGKMIEKYLDALTENPAFLPSVEAMLQRFAGEEIEGDVLQQQVYARIQDNPKMIVFPELLSWMFLQRKDYKNAFRQLKSIDRLQQEDGGRIFNLAIIAENDHDYDAAIEGYNYVVVEKGQTSPFYLDAQRNMLISKRKKITEGYAFTQAELQQLETEYENYITALGRNYRAAPLMLELANLEAFYLKNMDKAMALLEEVIALPAINREVQSTAKLSLGDFFLVKGERWEATLLYSQVDKMYKDDVMGHEARFKNAKLAYYFGDFTWAKTQFGVLKASTSKLISNDAIDMDVFILENTQDSIYEPLEMYAQAELLAFQNRYDDAFVKLDSLLINYPESSLNDDVIYLKGRIYAQLRRYDEAVKAFTKVFEDYKEDIRADNALYELAILYEGPLQNKEQAKKLYEQLFTEFSNSTLAVDARKRYRILRGDKITQ